MIYERLFSKFLKKINFRSKIVKNYFDFFDN